MGLFKEESLRKLTQTEVRVPKRTILIVDDELNNLTSLQYALHAHYEVLTASDGSEALELLSSDPDPSRIHLIISDQRMPQMTGVDFLARSLEIIPQTIRIILTGYTDVDAIVDSINEARIYKFIVKPFDQQDILLTIQRGLELYDLEANNRQLMDALSFLNGHFFNHMRGILQKISGSTEMLSSELLQSLTQEQHALLNEMGGSTENLIHLLNRASELSFVYTGYHPLHLEHLDILELIRSVGEHTLEAESTEVTLRFEWNVATVEDESGQYYLEADRELLTGALKEILENAIQYAPKPTEVVVSASIAESQFCIQVQDQGIGLAHEGGNHLSMPFIRGTRSQEFQPFGLGIGLAKAKAYIEAQGGTLLWEQLEQGTCVSLLLPFLKEQSEGTTVEENEEITTDSLAVLLWSNQETEFQDYADMLEFDGHDVERCVGPDQVQKQIQSRNVDVLLVAPSYQEKSTLPWIRQFQSLKPASSLNIVVVAPELKTEEQQDFIDNGVLVYTSSSPEYWQFIQLIHQ